MATTTFTVPVGDFFPATLQFVDAFGNIGEAPPGVAPVWTSGNTALMVVTVAADGLSANCATVGPAGNVDIAVVDTLTGSTLNGDLQVTITAGPVVGLSVIPGTPQV